MLQSTHHLMYDDVDYTVKFSTQETLIMSIFSWTLPVFLVSQTPHPRETANLAVEILESSLVTPQTLPLFLALETPQVFLVMETLLYVTGNTPHHRPRRR